MEQKHLNTMLLCMVVSGHIFFVKAKNKETACSPNDVVLAMTICQGERQQLSYASQLNNTPQLCKALQHYNDCMKPRVQGCQGPAKMAFDVITSKYTGDPYKCQLDVHTKKVVSNIPQQMNETITDKDYEDNLNTSNEVTADNSLDDNDDVIDVNQQTHSLNNSIETTSTAAEFTNDVSTTVVNTIENMTGSTHSNDDSNFAVVNKPTISTAAFTAVFIVIHTTLKQ